MLFLLFFASIFAGAVNAIAGGGTLLVFPALLAVLSPVEANATSTVALLPGTIASALAYRGELGSRRGLGWLVVASVVGGIVGALLVVRLPPKVFAAAIPWLILLSTLLLWARPLLLRSLRRAVPADSSHEDPPASAWLWAAQFAIAVYGGYFGAAMGILTLAAYGAAGMRNIHRMNAMKAVLTAGTNLVAALIFVGRGRIAWEIAGIMAAGAIAGGYLGARFALWLPPRFVQNLIRAIAVALTIYFFARG